MNPFVHAVTTPGATIVDRMRDLPLQDQQGGYRGCLGHTGRRQGPVFEVSRKAGQQVSCEEVNRRLVQGSLFVLVHLRTIVKTRDRLGADRHQPSTSSITTYDVSQFHN